FYSVGGFSINNQHNPLQTAALATKQSANTYGVYLSEIAAPPKVELWGQVETALKQLSGEVAK
ncbi:MAG: hypothetical protein RR954_09745, partial [Christensenellaceae bacterium]